MASERQPLSDDPELTDGDYPTEDTLDAIEKASPREALELAERAWHWDDWVTRTLKDHERLLMSAGATDDTEFIRFATGGWSGNESIISALNKNLMVRAVCWQLSARGGLHIYELPKQ